MNLCEMIQSIYINGLWKCISTLRNGNGSNVLEMATYSDGGLMSTKPYTCGQLHFKEITLKVNGVTLLMAYIGGLQKRI